MKKRYKILNGFVLLLLVAIIGLALTISYSSPCPSPSAQKAGIQMRAVLARCYGGPEILTIEQVALPEVAEDELLVKVKAAAVNPLDWHYMRGSPYLMRLSSGIGLPGDPTVGVDFSGEIVAAGAAVTEFEVGDEIFGGRTGAFADFILVRESSAIALKPANVSFEEAAALPIAGVTALQALKDHGQLQSGQRVLINGGSGGVGTYAIQIAKSMGAVVTGVASTKNQSLMQELGADYVVDYKSSNYTKSDTKYDLIIDMVGNHPLSDNMGVLEPNGRLINVGGPKGNWFAPLKNPLKGLFMDPFYDQSITTVLAVMDKPSIQTLADMMASGTLKSRLDRSYALEEIAEAIEYSESGRARGKIIVRP